jgi:hypothetical protein
MVPGPTLRSICFPTGLLREHGNNCLPSYGPVSSHLQTGNILKKDPLLLLLTCILPALLLTLYPLPSDNASFVDYECQPPLPRLWPSHLSVYNKWMFSEGEGFFGFPYSLFVTAMHFFVQFALAALLRAIWPQRFRPAHSPTAADYG